MVTEAGSYLRLIDFCITQLKSQGPSRSCNESKEEKEEKNPINTLHSNTAPGRGMRGGGLAREARERSLAVGGMDPAQRREIFIDNLLVRVHLSIEMILVDRPCATGV